MIINLLLSCYFLSLETSPFVSDTGRVDSAGDSRSGIDGDTAASGDSTGDEPDSADGDSGAVGDSGREGETGQHTGTDTAQCVTITWYLDSDGDGYGADAKAVEACDAPVGSVDRGGDCDDDRAEVNPGTTESCDGLDNDCDGSTDEGTTGTYYSDADGDGYGDEAATVAACEPSVGLTTVGGDCDDGNAAANPGVAEALDGADNDCDGYVDAEGVYDVAASDFYAYIPEYDLSDTCSGASGTVYVDLSSSPEFDGTASCTSPNFGALTTALEGDVDGYDVDITSTSTYGSIAYSGSFSVDFSTFTATTSGTVELSGVLVEYSGEVNLVRR